MTGKRTLASPAVLALWMIPATAILILVLLPPGGQAGARIHLERAAMKHFAQIAAWGREALLNHDTKCLAELIDENFNTRRCIYNLAPWQIQMVEVARQCGASAKFAGSGGAIIGTYQGEAMYAELCARLSAIGSRVIKPQVQQQL